MFKSVYHCNNKLALIGSYDLHASDQIAEAMINRDEDSPFLCKRVYSVEYDLEDNIQINLNMIKKYYMHKHSVNKHNVKEYRWNTGGQSE